MRQKNDIITLTRNELEAMIESAVTEKLLQLQGKHPDLFESFSYSSEDEPEVDPIFSEIDRLLILYEDGDLPDPAEFGDDFDYGIRLYIRHYKRGDYDFDLQDLLDSLKQLEEARDEEIRERETFDDMIDRL